MKGRSRRIVWALAAVALVPAGRAEGQAPDLGIVYRLLLEGQMSVTRADSSYAATLGGKLQNEDVVLTGPNSRAAIRFADDGSLVRLNPNSYLNILAEGEDRSSLVKTIELEAGELWANVTRADGERFRVRTPAGVAAVKGTEFLVRVVDGITTVITLEGVVEFFNDAGAVDVTAGNLVQLAALADAPVPRGATSEDLEASRALIDDPTGQAVDDVVEVELRLQSANGRVRSVVLELSRAEAQALLGGGG